MKRTLALTVVTALCAVSPFAAGAAISSLQQPDAPVTSYDGAQAEFVLRDYEGYVSVFAPGGDRKPLQVTASRPPDCAVPTASCCAAASPSAVRSSFCCCWRISARKKT